MNHRLALDHVLGLVVGAPCGESLILRGSTAMLAWAGERARPPADLDPRSEDGLVFDPGNAIVDATWGYAYNSVEGDGGVRVSLPWRRGDEHGSVQLDFAYDERLPEPPIFAAVPRADGGGPTVVWSAGPELSLVWKVRWMADDVVSDGRVAGKDLYDAVLLAELDRLKLPDRLRRMVSRAVPDPSVVRGWEVDWQARDDPRDWLDRLALALQD